MSTVWKVLVGLALALPLGAFVAGALVASSADEPAPRETIVIQDAPSHPDDRRDDGRRNDDGRPGQQGDRHDDDDAGDDRGDDEGGDSGDDDVEVVRPEPDTVDDGADDLSDPGGGGDDGAEDRGGDSDNTDGSGEGDSGDD
jgi:hypothetical protein